MNLDSSDSEKEGGDDDGVMVGAEEEEDDEDVFEDARSVRSFRSTRSGKSGKSGKGVVGGGTTPMWGRLSAEDEREVGVAKWVEKGHWDEVGDEVEEESDDEEEFTKRQAFKVGQFIDRWIGWRVFGQDDGESDDDEEEEGKEKEGRKKRVQLTEVKKERVPLSEEELRRVREKREEGVEEWKDPAWVLGVISNLVF